MAFRADVLATLTAYCRQAAEQGLALGDGGLAWADLLAVVGCPCQVVLAAARAWLDHVIRGQLPWAPLFHYAIEQHHRSWHQAALLDNVMMPANDATGRMEDYDFAPHLDAGLKVAAHLDSSARHFAIEKD